MLTSSLGHKPKRPTWSDGVVSAALPRLHCTDLRSFNHSSVVLLTFHDVFFCISRFYEYENVFSCKVALSIFQCLCSAHSVSLGCSFFKGGHSQSAASIYPHTTALFIPSFTTSKHLNRKLCSGLCIAALRNPSQTLPFCQLYMY